MCKKYSQYLRCIKFHFSSAASFLALYVAVFPAQKLQKENQTCRPTKKGHGEGGGVGGKAEKWTHKLQASSDEKSKKLKLKKMKKANNMENWKW